MRASLPACLALLGAVLAHPAAAETRYTRFATFLHVGPGMEYAVSDELQTHVAVDVVGCQNQWCQVKSGGGFGWVTQNILVAAPQPIVPPGGQRPVQCVDFARSGWPNGGDLENLCIYDQSAQKP